MVASSRCEKAAELKKGPWTAEEDQKLLSYIEEHGHGNWRALPGKAGLLRCGKSCRLRWTNYLRPDIKRGKFSLQEEQTIIQLHAFLGNRWSAIAGHLPKRTDNEIKNYWNTHLKKRLDKMGIDPATHKPKANLFGLSTDQAKDAATLRHVAQWETARLEAESRLARQAKLKIQTGSSSSASSSAQLANKALQARPARRPLCLDVLKAWQGAVFGMYSASTNCLESPTSALSFTEHVSPVAKCTETLQYGNPATRIEFATNHVACRSAGKMSQELDGSDQWDCFDELNQIPQVKLKPDSSNEIPMQEMASSTENAWLLNSFRVPNQNAPLGDIMEGLSEIYAPDFENQTKVLVEGENTNVSCGGNLEENKDYWNSLLCFADGSSNML